MKKTILMILAIALLKTVAVAQSMDMKNEDPYIPTLKQHIEAYVKQKANDPYQVPENKVVFKYNNCTWIVLDDNEGLLTGKSDICLDGLEKKENGNVEIDFAGQRIEAKVISKKSSYETIERATILKLIDFKYEVPKNEKYKINFYALYSADQTYMGAETTKHKNLTYIYATDDGYRKVKTKIKDVDFFFGNSYTMKTWLKRNGIAREGSVIAYEGNIILTYRTPWEETDMEWLPLRTISFNPLYR